ncbi:MAG: four helix bundle protein [Gemmatimonadales bacterium]
MGDFRQLEVWQKSQQLAGSIYRLTGAFPPAERYGLSAQMRRAAVSVSANLAEGCGRMGDAELRRFIWISLGSLAELERELMLAKDLQLVTQKSSSDLLRAIGSIRGMLHSLHRNLPISRVNPLDPRLWTPC